MHRKFFNAAYVFNVVIQAIFSLVSPALVGFGVAWLIVTRLNAGEWVYAVLIVLGIISGFIGMIRFVLSAMAGISRLEGEWEISEKNEKALKEEKNGEEK